MFENVIKALIVQGKKFRISKKNCISIAGLFIMMVLFGVLSNGQMFTAYNLTSILNQSLLIMIGGLGASFLFAQGAMDLSMGSTIGLSCILGAYASQIHPILCFPVAIITAITINTVNGFLYAYSGISVFVMGLSMSFLIRGTLLPLSGNQSAIKMGMNATIFDTMPIKIGCLLICFLIVTYIFNYTSFGKKCRAVGAGAEASVQSGVDVARTKILAFVINGVFVGIVCCMNMIRTGSAGTNSGLSFEFNVMIALILGGMPIEGGSDAKIRCIVFGALLVTVMTVGMVLCGADSRMQEVVKGVLFILVVVGTMLMDKKRR